MNITVTLIGQMVAFILLIWFVNRVIWGPVSQMLDRQKKIADGLAAADRGQHDLELAEKRATDILKDAKNQAGDIITQAQKRAGEIVEESKDTARAEGEKLITAAKAEIERESNQAAEQLRGQVAAIALQGAEKVLRREVDANTHSDMLKDLAAQI